MVGYGKMAFSHDYGNADKERLELLDLSIKKSQIESQIAAFYQILSTNNVGMHEPLVDPEGFPRNDIDVYQVRNARHRIICFTHKVICAGLQNDHKGIMQQLEAGLSSYHAAATAAASTSEPLKPDDILEAFACVTLVHPGSPADISGLRVDDFVVEFGSVNKENFNSLKDIATVVRCSIRQEVPVVVKRRGSNSVVRLKLTPMSWSGQGFLGCKIDPFISDNAER